MLGMVPRPKQIRKSKLDILSKESFESIYRACKGNCIRCHTNFRHPFNLSWSGKTCDIRRSSKTTS